ncbi:hypothetical protein SEPCBS119000_005422 [Sporothrix epigloea]|uniref:Pre-mRNA-splicing factor SPF27 n=1 Tax=Sporothrix epigloea TaxID=1892477 RepID=A0ABP0DXK0_9PEZI
MPFITSIHDSLPYVDPEPTPTQREAAEALIAAERATVPDDPNHALLRPLYEPKYTPVIAKEIQRHADAKARGAISEPLRALDLSRYEMNEVPLDGTEVAENALTRAYVSQEYLRGRRAHLALLDRFGKNAWLISNWQTEADLKRLEADLAETRKAVDLMTIQRQNVQGEAAGELQSLDGAWRTGVGQVLETEAAAEELRLQILETRRLRAIAGENLD